MSADDNDRTGARRAFRGAETPISLYDAQRDMDTCSERLIELEDELRYANARLVEAERAWKGHKALVNTLLVASGERTNEDWREAEVLTRSDSEGRLGIDLQAEFLTWNSQVDTIKSAVSMTQTRSSNARKIADTILAAGG